MSVTQRDVEDMRKLRDRLYEDYYRRYNSVSSVSSVFSVFSGYCEEDAANCCVLSADAVGFARAACYSIDTKTAAYWERSYQEALADLIGFISK